jgi:predicted RNA-binding protein with TRAM domain
VWVDGGEQTDPPIYRGQIRHVLIEEVNERGEGVVHAENGLTIFVTGASARNDDVAILVTELRPDENAATAEVLE